MSYDTRIEIRIPEDLRDKVEAHALAMGHTISGFVRYVLRQWCDPNAVTIEQARTLVDPGVEYEVGSDE